jgi:vanillate O-demethylase ferredoxin subunit
MNEIKGMARLRARVHAITCEAENINSYELVDPAGGELPPFAAGAHLDFHLPDGNVRQYSLCSDSAERHSYLLAIQREPRGRGGSHAIFAQVRIDDIVTLSPPRSNFRLREEASRHLLLAGGIGVTPMMAMVHRLRRIGADFILHYCARGPEKTAFRDALAPLAAAGQVFFHHDGGDPNRGLDIAELLRRYSDGMHLYYCGPVGFMRSAANAAAHWPKPCVHFEHFTPPMPDGTLPVSGPALAGAVEFQVKLARSGAVFDVPPGQSIVDVLRKNGIEVATSCESGLCGTCRTAYLEGEPDHRDMILDDEERRDDVLICCARSKTPLLVLDL